MDLGKVKQAFVELRFTTILIVDDVTPIVQCLNGIIFMKNLFHIEYGAIINYSSDY